MLYILTGDIQTGKTRWLKETVERLKRDGVVCYGVMAPGDWVSSDSPQADANGFEKLGIWNVLLPEGARIRFADRKDIAEAQGTFDAGSQAGKMGMGWHIYDDAIAQVNQHFADLSERIDEENKPAVLIVDELGHLELRRDGGLTEAIALLEQGPRGSMQDALIVVREEYAPIAEDRFAEKWGGSKRVVPNDGTELQIG